MRGRLLFYNHQRFETLKLFLLNTETVVAISLDVLHAEFIVAHQSARTEDATHHIAIQRIDDSGVHAVEHRQDHEWNVDMLTGRHVE